MGVAPALVIFSGLPGVGKTAIAKELAQQTGAIHLRIDSIEQALRDSGKITRAMEDAGYRVAYAIAEERLRAGHSVVADCVNPIQITRDVWRDIALVCGAAVVEVEVRCSDRAEHRRRVENRDSDVPGLRLPTWQEVLKREYEPWDREHIVVDTALSGVQDAVGDICRAISGAKSGKA